MFKTALLYTYVYVVLFHTCVVLKHSSENLCSNIAPELEKLRLISKAFNQLRIYNNRSNNQKKIPSKKDAQELGKL